MPITRLMVPGEMEPVSHYCHVVRAGDHVWLSGMVGMTADGEIPDDTVEQFRIALATMPSRDQASAIARVSCPTPPFEAP